ncbi:MAG: hypothetical protein RL514_4141 [Verrucomicrobiota bacterium]
MCSCSLRLKPGPAHRTETLLRLRFPLPPRHARGRFTVPFPNRHAHPGTQIYLPEIPADRQAIGNCKKGTSCNREKIGSYKNFTASSSQEIGNYKRKISSNS